MVHALIQATVSQHVDQCILKHRLILARLASRQTCVANATKDRVITTTCLLLHGVQLLTNANTSTGMHSERLPHQREASAKAERVLTTSDLNASMSTPMDGPMAATAVDAASPAAREL